MATLVSNRDKVTFGEIAVGGHFVQPTVVPGYIQGFFAFGPQRAQAGCD